ncbi:MAG: hypothetical protein LK562_13725, partial [Candidatus Accumulibacter phosphatis]|nr:hypothetical protein [Candidatus Accumulibacter phosphatis]
PSGLSSQIQKTFHIMTGLNLELLAERFFGCTHETLFSQVLQRMPLPPRPASRRPRPPTQPYLIPLAA